MIDLVFAALDVCVLLVAAVALFVAAALAARAVPVIGAAIARALRRPTVSTPTPTPSPAPSPHPRRRGPRRLTREDRLRGIAQTLDHLRGRPHLPVPLIEAEPVAGGPVRLLLPMLDSGSPRLLLAWIGSLRHVDDVRARPLGRELAEVVVTGTIGRGQVQVLAHVRLELPPLAAGETLAPLPLRVLRDWAPAGAAPAARVMAAIAAAGGPR